MEIVASGSGDIVDEQLEQIAERIDREFQLAIDAGATMLAHAMTCGDHLIEAKSRVPRGGWEAWLLATFPDRSLKTLRVYMRLAKYRAQVDEMGVRSIEEAYRLLAGKPQIAHSDELRQRAVRLHVEERKNYAEIAAELGVSHHSVSIWCNPARAEQVRDRRGQQSKEARREASQAARAQEVLEHGGFIDDAYRKTTLAIQSLRELLDLDNQAPKARTATQRAIAKLQAAQDEMIAAVRGSAGPDPTDSPVETRPTSRQADVAA